MKTSALLLALVLPLSAFAGDMQAGQKLFTARCAWCHAVGPSARSSFGPHLNGVIGRTAGGIDDYKYSPAMKHSGIVWSEKNLSAFVQDPGKVVPGTRMRFWGIGDKKDIEDLLAYLRQFH